MMGGEAPARGAAHRETAHDQPVLIYRVLLAHALERLEQVHFAGKPVGVAVATIEMQHERVWRCEFARRSLALVDERQFRQSLAPAVEPEVQPVAVRARRLIGSRHDQTIRLNRAVNLRHVAPRDEPGRIRPGSETAAQRSGPLHPLLQQRSRDLDLVGLVEFIVSQRPIHRLVIYLYVRQQVGRGAF